ncbi:HAMP domain-containing sensor histidine kinase [Actinoplanes sp. NBRC 101535]|uniref:sensor histidine kinase n=1 Tax=Actinoplanes sp. NBRC 101535 TaxID=3032196 RepID=UPI0024A32732|nr:HAMP domain-containing sensor histidine kinase [Actinoplanes sp. NBRC 101535]GLY07081.1 two-component sensor histidine kinase [Actinoplanes sp. NBRC 101535]
MRAPGLRARVTTGFAAGALCLSAVMAVVSYQITRQSLLAEREETAVRAAYYDAAIVRAGMSARDPDIADILSTIDTGESRRAVMQHQQIWYARNADSTGISAAVPETLQRRAGEGHSATQRIRVDGTPTMVIAIPLSAETVYYEVDSLAELDRTLRLVALVLAVVALGTALVGAALGRYAGRYVLRPLDRVERAARDISAGRTGSRLDPAAEPDLADLASSFNHMVDELSARVEKDRRFAADVSHELRSPLQTLAAAASVLDRRRDKLDERSAMAAQLVTDEVERFQRLVEDLLVLSRAQRAAERRLADVRELTVKVCRRCRVDEDRVEMQGEPAWSVDARRVEQILTNLIENAQAYGGGVTAVRLVLVDGRGRIEVDDDGPGVAADDKPAIFDRFVRGRAAHARADGRGTGLGLAIVAQHAAAHGGSATVLDRPGGGARFRVELGGCRP